MTPTQQNIARGLGNLIAFTGVEYGKGYQLTFFVKNKPVKWTHVKRAGKHYFEFHYRSNFRQWVFINHDGELLFHDGDLLNEFVQLFWWSLKHIQK